MRKQFRAAVDAANLTVAFRLIEQLAQVYQSEDDFDSYVWVSKEVGDLEAALKYAQLGLSLHPDSLYLNLRASWIYLRLHMCEDCLRHCEKALEIDPGNADAIQRIIRLAHFLLLSIKLRAADDLVAELKAQGAVSDGGDWHDQMDGR